MKRGRPSSREEYRREILEVLCGYQYPATTTTVKGLLDGQRLHPSSWHTVRKYLQELAVDRLVCRDTLPAEHGRRPLVVYVSRGPPLNGNMDLL